MSIFSKIAFVGAIGLLAGCAQESAPPVVPYNPPPAATTALTPAEIAWRHVAFASNSAKIDAAGMETVRAVVASMKGNPALMATVVGKADTVGSDARNMRLAKRRATAVRDAIMHEGKLPASRIEVRWTGERPQGGAAPTTGSDATTRVVDIGLH